MKRVRGGEGRGGLHLYDEDKAGLASDGVVPGLQPWYADPPGREVPTLHILQDAFVLGVVRGASHVISGVHGASLWLW